MTEPGAAAVHLAAASVETVQAPLSAVETRRLAGLANPARRRQFIAGRQLLRGLLGAVFGPHATGWNLSAQAGEAPRVEGRPGLYLSLAHSGEHVVAAVALVPVGVDVEAVRVRRDLDGLVAMTCGEGEQAWLTGLNATARPRHFLALWTLKEAHFKSCAAPGEGRTELIARTARPCTPADANGWTWQQPGAVTALVAPPGSRLLWHGPAPGAEAARWHVTAAPPPG